MEVKLDRKYPLDVDLERAWQVLRDVPTVAGCMPGAAITGQTDEAHYQGTVKVKIGPAVASFAGDIEVRGLDADAHRLQMIGKGADRGGSTASMELTATLEPGEGPERSVLAGQATVTVNGKLAQFGGRMMVQVSDMLLAQFVDNFRATAASLPATVTASAAPAGTPEGTPAAAAELPAPAAGPVGGPAAAAVAASPAAPPQARVAPQVAREINALAILWGLVKSWFGSLFRRGS